MQVYQDFNCLFRPLFLYLLSLSYLLLMTDILPGTILISDPFLKDPNFMRTVVLLCDHRNEGSFGFVLNKLYDSSLEDLLQNANGIRFPVYEGGPVQKDTLHFLHQQPELIHGGQEVTDGIFWGGGENQLADELTEKSWITGQANKSLVFQVSPAEIWKSALAKLGGEYSQMVNYPIDPQLN
jgi:putative transcriptional regulator